MRFLSFSLRVPIAKIIMAAAAGVVIASRGSRENVFFTSISAGKNYTSYLME
jgi:hypothetical protein